MTDKSLRQRVNSVNIMSMTKSSDEAFDSMSVCCSDLLSCINKLCAKWVALTAEELKDKTLSKKKDNFKSLNAGLIKKTLTEATTSIRKTAETGENNLDAKWREIHSTYVNTYDRYVSHDVDMLYFSTLQEATRTNCLFPTLVAHAEITCLLLEISCNTFDNYIAEIEGKTGRNMRLLFIDYRPSAAFNRWKQFMKALYARIHPSKDFRTGDINMAYDILFRRFKQGDFLNEAAKIAIEAVRKSESEVTDE